MVCHTASLLFSRWERVSQLKLVSEEAYTKLITERKLIVSPEYNNDISFVDGSVSEKQIQEWVKEEQTLLVKSNYGMRTSELSLISCSV